MGSMQKLIDSGRELTLFTSRGKIVPNIREARQLFLDYITGLEHQVKYFKQKGLSEDEIVTQIFGRESSLAELTNVQLTAKNLICSLL